MNKLIIAASAALMICGGCRVVEIENKGEEIARDKDGNPVLVEGKIQTIKRGWSVWHNQHWMMTEADTLTASIKADEIAFALNGLNSKPDGQSLVSLVKESLAGCSELAVKIGTAIATCGAAPATEGAAGAIATLAKTAYSSFVNGGGDANKATVSTSADGTVTVSDGSICTTCKDGSCTTGACNP